MGEVTIREVADDHELRNSARVVRNAFRTVALELNLTKDNCPTHPSFITTKRLKKDRRKGVKLFGLFLGDGQIGLVAVENAGAYIHYVERLAVLPEHRHSGYGKRLMEFACEHVRMNGGKKVSIGVIDEHTVLKDWYRDIGFKETSTRKYAHLPFTVCFMEKDISPWLHRVSLEQAPAIL